MTDTELSLPLHDVRVVSLAVNVPGPVAAVRLRELGADVLRVVPPTGDPLEHAAPEWHRELVRGQPAVTLDLKVPGDRERLDSLLDGADLMLTSMRPAALARLGLTGAGFRARHPGLCHVAITGHAGAGGDLPGHDLTFQAAAGLVRPPSLPVTLVADLAAAERAVSTALAMLLARERGAGGAYREVSIEQAVSAFADPVRHGLTSAGGLLGGAVPVYGLYPASEGWVAVAALEPHFLSRLTEALALPDLEPATLHSAFGARTADEWERWAAALDLPLVAVRDAGRSPTGERRESTLP
jgi:alpha-methylacyl-CoA racemase